MDSVPDVKTEEENGVKCALDTSDETMDIQKDNSIISKDISSDVNNASSETTKQNTELEDTETRTDETLNDNNYNEKSCVESINEIKIILGRNDSIQAIFGSASSTKGGSIITISDDEQDYDEYVNSDTDINDEAHSDTNTISLSDSEDEVHIQSNSIIDLSCISSDEEEYAVNRKPGPKSKTKCIRVKTQRPNPNVNNDDSSTGESAIKKRNKSRSSDRSITFDDETNRVDVVQGEEVNTQLREEQPISSDTSLKSANLETDLIDAEIVEEENISSKCQKLSASTDKSIVCLSNEETNIDNEIHSNTDSVLDNKKEDPVASKNMNTIQKDKITKKEATKGPLDTISVISVEHLKGTNHSVITKQKNEVKRILDSSNEPVDISMENSMINKDDAYNASGDIKQDNGFEELTVAIDEILKDDNYDEKINTESENNAKIESDNNSSCEATCSGSVDLSLDESVILISDNEQSDDDICYNYGASNVIEEMDVTENEYFLAYEDPTVVDSIDLCDISSDEEEYLVNRKPGPKSKTKCVTKNFRKHSLNSNNEENAKKKHKSLSCSSNEAITINAGTNNVDVVMDEQHAITIHKEVQSVEFDESIKSATNETDDCVDVEITKEENVSLERKEIQPPSSDDNIKLLNDKTDSEINMSSVCNEVQSFSSDENIKLSGNENDCVDEKIIKEVNITSECKEVLSNSSDDRVKILNDETVSEVNTSAACQEVQSISIDENKSSDKETNRVNEEIANKINTSESKNVQPVSGDENIELSKNKSDHVDTEIIKEVKISAVFKEVQSTPIDEKKLSDKKTDCVDEEITNKINTSETKNVQPVSGDENIELSNNETNHVDTEIAKEVNIS